MVGDRVTLSGTEQKLAQLAYSTRGVIPDGMLVRVSSIDQNAESAWLMQQSFIADLAGRAARGGNAVCHRASKADAERPAKSVYCRQARWPKDWLSRSISAVVWGSGGALLRMVLQFAVQITIARALGPSEYGVFAIGLLVVTFSMFFADVGLSAQLIQKAEVSDDDIRFIFTFQVVIGGLVSATLLLASNAIATFFAEPRAADVVRALAVLCLVNAIASPANNLLRRHLQQKRLQACALGSYVVGFIFIGIPMALMTHSVWSLVVAWLVQGLVAGVSAYALVRHPVRPLWWHSGAKDQGAFGGVVFITNIVNWLVTNIDRLVIGRLLPTRDIGLYNQAYSLYYAPVSGVMGVVYPVFLSTASQVAGRAGRQPVRDMYLGLTAGIAYFALPLLAGASAISETVFAVLFGHAWAGSAPLGAPIALAMVPLMLYGIASPLVWVSGRRSDELRSQWPLVLLWAVAAIGLGKWGWFSWRCLGFARLCHAQAHRCNPICIAGSRSAVAAYLAGRARRNRDGWHLCTSVSCQSACFRRDTRVDSLSHPRDDRCTDVCDAGTADAATHRSNTAPPFGQGALKRAVAHPQFGPAFRNRAMNWTDWIFPSILLVGALLAGLAVVATVGMSLEVERRVGARTLAAVPLLICAGIVVGTVASGRSLRYAEQSIASIYSGAAGGGSIQRLITAAVLALCLARIVNLLWRKQRWGGSGAESSVFFGLLTYFAVMTVVNPLATDQPVVHNSLYSIGIFAAIYITRREGGVLALLEGMRAALLFLMLADLLLAAVKPDMAVQQSSGVLLPGLRFRLWGVEAHPNGAGSSALILLVLLATRPFQWRPLNWLGWVSGLSVLLLAQSKTAWAIALLVTLILVYYRYGRNHRGLLRPTFVLAVMACALVAFGVLAYVDIERVLRKVFLSKELDQLESATGRIAIWHAAIDTWLANPILGYGPDAWGPIQRMRLGMPFALHAHNQFLQVLSVGGLVAGLVLVAYLLAMCVASFRSARVTAGASVALMTFMLVRSTTEIPLSLGSLFSGDLLIHLTWFALVLTGLRDNQAVAAAPVRRTLNATTRPAHQGAVDAT